MEYYVSIYSTILLVRILPTEYDRRKKPRW
jgi:hypothetical protein